MTAQPELILSDLRFPEGSRWRDGKLYFSDMHTGQVLSYEPDTEELTEITVLAGQPSGLGWAPNGDLLVSSMLDNRVVRVDASGEQSTWADLSGLTDLPTNELLVTEDGHGYLGGFGWNLYDPKEPEAPGPVFHISPDGSAELAAEGFIFPNGTVQLPGTNVLVVAETWGRKLTAFDIRPDGSLTGQRVWAPLWDTATADGTTVDADGGIWISSIVEHLFVRVVEGGEVTHRIDMGAEMAVDCAVGGADGRTLFLSTSNSWAPAETVVRAGKVYAVDLDAL